MKKVQNKLRIVHFPQVGSLKKAFTAEVKDEEQAAFAINLLANQHLWLEQNMVIPNYSNAIFVEMYDETKNPETGEPFGWSNYYNEEEMMEWDELEETYLRESATETA